MARITRAPEELLEFAEKNGWTVNEFLPDRFDACASKQVDGATVIVTRESKTRRWMWSVDRGRNWGRGNRVGRADHLAAAAGAALDVAAADTAPLF